MAKSNKDKRDRKEYYRQYSKRYWKKHKKHLNIKNLHHMWNLRMQAFEYLGNKCQVCDVNDWRMLQINHINGNGRKEVTGSQKHRLYRDIVAGKRKDINLLCANHNALYEYERGKRGKYLKEFKKITEDAEKKYDEGRQS